MSVGLRERADSMLAATGVLSVLGAIGDARLHGSYDLDTMTWPELDIAIHVDRLTPATAMEVVAALGRCVAPKAAMALNQLDGERLFAIGDRPTALVDFRFEYENTLWKLDILLFDEVTRATGKEYNEFLKRVLTTETREVILDLKKHLHALPTYSTSRWYFRDERGMFGARDIYRAVTRYGVTNLQQFAQFLKHTRGIDIQSELPANPWEDDPRDSFSIVVG